MIFFGTLMTAFMAFFSVLIVGAFVTELLWDFVVLPLLVILAFWEICKFLWHWRR